MKKLLLTLALTVCLVGSAYADALDVGGIVDKIEFKQGIAYSLIDNGINYLSTIEVLKKKGFALELGYAGDLDSVDHRLVAVVSYELFKLKDYIDIPVLDLIEANIGYYVGVGSINGHRLLESEFDHGPALSLIKIKF